MISTDNKWHILAIIIFVAFTVYMIKLSISDYEDNIEIERANTSIVTVAEKAQTFKANDVQFNMIRVDGGTFTMGLSSEETYITNRDKPAHKVSVSSFFIGETEVTQALWMAIMNNNPAEIKGDLFPVENVSWNDCQTFIRKLNAATKDQLPEGCEFRLCTEAEWEFARRGGIKRKYNPSATVDDVAWYNENSEERPHRVALKRPNELGIYDMSGNVSEWCRDGYDRDYYKSSPSMNPCNYTESSKRVNRGGSYYNNSMECQASSRYALEPANRSQYIGLRLAL